ncbi:MAG: ubiquinol oxidase subunit II [Candidatus Saccharimonadales bacterium]
MSKIKQKSRNRGFRLLLIPLFLCVYAILIRFLVKGKNFALFNPKGLIAHEQHSLLVFYVTVLLVIAFSALFLLFFTAWKYRETNTKVVHSPESGHSKNLVVGMWIGPTVIMLVLASIMWTATHKLAPQKKLESDTKTLRIQVISMRWKWLFMYPDQKIATVNFVQLPVNTPVQFELTADEAPMSSFWIPNLGGQLYSMTSHVNRLNLMADTMGDFPGSSAEINGAGFSGMKFTTRVTSRDNFDNWVQDIKSNQDALYPSTYQKVLQPSENNPVAFYSSYESDLYDKVITKYRGPSGGHSHQE